MATITAANAVFMIRVPGLIPQIKLQGFATDDAFASQSVKLTESKMGVDGKKSTGYIFQLYEMTVSLQADSASNDVFDTWAGAMKQLKESINAQATIVIAATGKTYNCVDGSLEDYQPMPEVKGTLQHRSFKIVWQSIDGAPQ